MKYITTTVLGGINFLQNKKSINDFKILNLINIHRVYNINALYIYRP